VSRSQLQPQDWFDRINGMFRQATQRPWCDRLQRPSTIVDPRTGDSSAMSLARYWTPRDRYLDMLWSYRIGDPPLPQIKPEYHDVFRHVLRKARSNYAPMCIAAMLDRLELQDISTLIDQDTDGDDLAADIMDETGFIAVSKDWFDQGLSMGESYAMVVPGVEGQSEVLETTGKPCPSIHAIDPRRCIGIPDLSNPVRLAAAVVHQYDPMLGSHTAYLFLPGWKWTLNWNLAGSSWDLADTKPERIQGLDALGGIPIVRFENLNGLGEYEPHIDLLDRINDVTLQRIIGFWYQALRQRVLSGDEDDEDEDSPESQAPVDLNKVFKAGPGELWQIPADFKIQELQQADFGPLLNGKRDDVKEFAAVTSTPLHLITPDAANGSAQGAGLLREALTAKVRDRRARFTPPLKLLWRMTFALAGAQDRGRKMKLHWGPIEFHTLAEQASASAQAQGTLSAEDRCERIWDLSPDETKQNMTRLTADSLLGLPTAPTGTAAQTPPGVTNQENPAGGQQPGVASDASAA
jgi:hypothetical protein